MKLKKDNLLFIIIHLIFVILCFLILVLFGFLPIGIRLFILVISYNLLTPIIFILQKHQEIFKVWLFCFILSLFQLWPDWFLSAVLNILVFPEDGLFKIGTVSGYMLGLWTIPLFIIIYIGNKFNEKYSNRTVYLVTAIFSLLIFGSAEATMWMLQSWYAQNVITIFGHIAIYIIVPEILLGLSSYYMFDKIKDSNYLVYIIAAFIIMILYLGNACFFYFLFEKVIFII